jgi:hypothetical protein
VAGHDQAARVLPQDPACRPQLLDHVADADRWTEIVARDRDANAKLVQAAGEMAERGAVERAPVAAVDQHDQRRLVPS